MPFTPHYLLQFGGTVGNVPGETWSCGIRLMAPDGWGGFDEVDYLNGLAKDALAAWYVRAGSKIGNNSKLAFAKMNFINAEGHYDDPGNTNAYYWPTPVTGGVTSAAQPFQISVVLGWRTNDVTRGYASKGRIYSPAPVVSISPSTGLFPAADALAMATSAALLLNTLDVGFGGGGGMIRPAIMSGVDGSWHQIDWVWVDNRIDTQRRRAAQVVGVQSKVEVLY